MTGKEINAILVELFSELSELDLYRFVNHCGNLRKEADSCDYRMAFDNFRIGKRVCPA